MIAPSAEGSRVGPHLQNADGRTPDRWAVRMTDQKPLLNLMATLRDAKIHFEVFAYRADAITLVASVPGQRWEIEVLEDGSVQFERFVSDGTMHGADSLHESIRGHGEVD